MSNIQKQHKISPAIAWLTIQKFIIFYCPLDGEHTSANTGGFFLFFMADKKRNSKILHIDFTSSRCRVSVGQHCKYNISLVILEVQTVLRSISKLLFWLLLSYWSSKNPLFLSNKKSWWRELNPWPLPYQGSALPLSHISIVSDLPFTVVYVTKICSGCQSLFQIF